MSFLPDHIIEENLESFISSKDGIERRNGKPAQLQPSSYELRLGEEVFLSGEKKLVRLGQERADISIKPGDFAILLTYESVNIPEDLMALISIKTTYKNMGLVNISGFHVDPGWTGKLTFSVYNAGPGEIILRYQEPIFVIFFATLGTAKGIQGKASSKWPYKGEHQGQDKISSKDMNKLTGKPVSPFELETRLKKLEYTSTIQWGLLVALTIGMLIAFVKTLL